MQSGAPAANHLDPGVLAGNFRAADAWIEEAAS
jgi:hypothetical protein